MLLKNADEKSVLEMKQRLKEQQKARKLDIELQETVQMVNNHRHKVKENTNERKSM